MLSDQILKIAKQINGGLTNPGLFEAREFVAREWLKQQRTLMTQPLDKVIKSQALFKIIKKITKKFNAWENPEAKFTVDDLVKYYVDDKNKDFASSGIKKMRPEKKHLYHIGG